MMVRRLEIDRYEIQAHAASHLARPPYARRSQCGPTSHGEKGRRLSNGQSAHGLCVDWLDSISGQPERRVASVERIGVQPWVI